KSMLQLLLQKPCLTVSEAENAMDLILDGADPHQIAAFLAILKYRGEKPSELAGMALSAQKKAVAVHAPFPVMDIVGTGGDGANTVNISTGAALLAAACGIPIAKHGNRSVSSRCGSADLLEELGIDLEAPSADFALSLQQVGIAFM